MLVALFIFMMKVHEPQFVREMHEESRRFGIEVVTFDERLTSIMAEKVLMETGVRREDRKAVKDKIAAQLILQSYLDMLSASGQESREETGTI